jgi:hypothetical protein
MNMESNNRPGGATPLGRAISSVLIAAVLTAGAYWYVTRPKVEVPPTTTPAAQTVDAPAKKADEPVRVETPQAPQPTPKEVAPATKQQPTAGSDDPYSNLSTKGTSK